MEHKNTEEKPGPSGISDLIIITPDELAKLGLFQDLQTQKVNKPKVENLEAKKIILNQTKVNTKEKSPLTLKSKVLGKPSNTLSEGSSTKPPQKILNPEIQIVNDRPKGIVEKSDNIKGQTILNSKFLNTHLKTQSSLTFNKMENPAKLNRMYPPKNAPILDSSKSQPKILNADLKFEQRKLVIAQKKSDWRKHIQQMSSNKHVEKSTAEHVEINKNISEVAKDSKSTCLASMRDILTKALNKKPEVINPKIDLTGIVDKTQSRTILPSNNPTPLEETLRRGLNRILQKDIIKPSNVDEVISVPAIIIEDGDSELDTPSTSNIIENKKRATFGEKEKRNTVASVAFQKGNNSLVETIDLDDSDDFPKQIPSNNIKKEVKIISNTPVRLSNEELKHLVFKPKSISQNNSPLKISSRENTEHVIQPSLPIELNTDFFLSEVETSNNAKYTETEKLDLVQNVSVNVKVDMLDLPATKIEVETEEKKKSCPTKRETSQVATQHSEEKSNASLTANKTNIKNQKTLPKLLALPKPISATNTYRKKNLENKEMRNISETAGRSQSKVKKEEAVFKSTSCNRTYTNCNDGGNTILSTPEILHKSSDTNEVRTSLPSSSKMVDASGLYDTQQQETVIKCKSKNIPPSEGLKSTGENLEGTDVNKELGEIKQRMKKNTKNLHMSIDKDINQRKRVNKELSDTNITEKIEQEGFHSESPTVSTKHESTFGKSTVNSKKRTNRIYKVGSSEIVKGQTEEDIQLTKSKGKTMKKHDILVENKETVKPHKSYERKHKIKKHESGILVREDDILEITDTSEATEVNSCLENIGAIPKKRGRPRKSTNLSVKEKSRNAVVDLTETSGDVRKNESNISEGCKDDLNEKILEKSNNKNERANQMSKDIYKMGASETVADSIEESTQLTKSKDETMEKREIPIENKESVKPHRTHERKQKIKARKSNTIVVDENIPEATHKSEANKVSNSLEDIEPVPRKRGRCRISTSLSVKEKSKVSNIETSCDVRKNNSQITESKNKTIEKSDIPIEYKSSTIVREEKVLDAADKSKATDVNNCLKNIEAVPKKRGRRRKSTVLSVKEKSSDAVAESKVATTETSSDVRKTNSNLIEDCKADSNEKLLNSGNTNRNKKMDQTYKDVCKTDSSKAVVEEIAQLTKSKNMEKGDIPPENKSGIIVREEKILEETDKSEVNKVNDCLENVKAVPRKKGRPRKSTSSSIKEKLMDYVAEFKEDTTETSGDVHRSEPNVNKDNKADSNEKIKVEPDLEPFNTSSLKGEDNAKQNVKGNLISVKSLINKSEDLQVETSKSIDICEKLPRKKGRPKKVVNLEEVQEKHDALPSLEKNPKHMITSTPLPKKRGRKRKSAIAECSTEDLTELMILDESRSGRKRKKVDYFQMENNLSDEEEVDQKRRKRRTGTQIKAPVVKDGEIKQCIEGSNEDNKQNDNVENMEETVNTSLLNSNECELGKDLKEKDENDIKPDCGDKNKNKKIKRPRNKNTIKMLNSIFTAAVQNKSKHASGAEEQELESPNIILSTCDRRTNEALVSRCVIDEDNMVTCMTCKTKINNDEWDIHNRNVHYCLAWREGDPELNLNDIPFLTRTLTPLMKQEKELKCKKCGKAYTRVNNFIAHMEKCGIVSSGDLVTCAVCKVEIEKMKWSFHKQKQHNNLAWRIGDHPLNLNDKDLVLNILNALYKAKKPLRCEKCDTTKKSVVGFLSHQAQCGRSTEDAQVKCEFCDRKVLPVSMQSHIKLAHETPKIKEIEGTPNYFTVDSNATSSKRQAAKRAMLVIDRFSREKLVQEYAKHFLQNVNFKEEQFVTQLLQKELAENNIVKCKFNSCIFQSEEVETVVDHMDSCEHKPDRYFICKKCLLISDTEENIRKHLKEAYNIDIIDDDYKVDYGDDDMEEDFEEEEELIYSEPKKNRSDKVIASRMKHPHLCDVREKKPGTLFRKAFKLTMEFCEEYLSQSLLFDHLRYWDSDFSTLDEDLVGEYLPKYLESCDVAWTKDDTFQNVVGKDYTFKKFEIFETAIDEGIATIYCGGPIYAMAWMPTPHTSLNSKQILAVAPAKCFETHYLTSKWYNEPSVIQFWDFGVLKNHQEMTKPTMRFSLAIDFGPVWHLEWCPSGCYDSTEDNGPENKLARMGLLAVAASDGVVYIYSIPFLYEEDVGSILKVKPSLKLCVVAGNSKSIHHEEFYAVKISWSMGVGHKYIAVGYTDGLVALFDISTNASLLKDKDNDGVDILRPIKMFPAHYHYISALHLLHNDDGKRWLLSGSFDRDVHFWDLSNGSKQSHSSVGKKFIVTDGVWLTNWLSHVITYDASTTFCPVPATLRSVRDHMCDRVNLTYSNTSIKSISASNWLNGIIHGNSVGDIMAVFPHSLYSLESEKHLRNYRYFFGCVKLINKQKSPKERVEEEIELQNVLHKISGTNDSSKSSNSEKDKYNLWEPFTYNEGAAKYGVVFCDKKMDKISDFLTSNNQSKYDTESEMIKPEIYPMRAINKIAYNPNLQASLYYATGYQCGFVRLTYMKFWEKDPHLDN